MRILLTGAGGLLGSHLLPLLMKKGYEVFTISSSIENSKNFNIDFSKHWSANLLPSNLDVIIHLAQSEDFRIFPGKAEEVFNVNTLSTVKLLNHAVKTGVKKFIYASSGGVYGSGDIPFKEDYPVNYKSSMGFYIASKHCSEIILDNFTSLLNVLQLRFFFIYGMGQRKDMLVSRIIENVKYGKSIQLAGDEGMKINPIHATDAAIAIISSLKLQGSEKINIGGPEVLSLKRISTIIGMKTGLKPIFEIDKNAAPINILGDISKMILLLGAPKINFQDGINTLT